MAESKDSGWDLQPLEEGSDGSKFTVLVSAPYFVPHVERLVPVLERFKLNVIVADVQERLEAADIMRYSR